LSKKERKKDPEKRCSAVFLSSLDVAFGVLRDGLLEFDCTRCVLSYSSTILGFLICLSFFACPKKNEKRTQKNDFRPFFW